MEFLSRKATRVLAGDYELDAVEQRVMNKWVRFEVQAGVPALVMGSAVPVGLARIAPAKNNLYVVAASVLLGFCSLAGVTSYSLKSFYDEIATTDTQMGEAARGLTTSQAYERHLRNGGDPNSFVPPYYDIKSNDDSSFH